MNKEWCVCGGVVVGFVFWSPKDNPVLDGSDTFEGGMASVNQKKRIARESASEARGPHPTSIIPSVKLNAVTLLFRWLGKVRQWALLAMSISRIKTVGHEIISNSSLPSGSNVLGLPLAF